MSADGIRLARLDPLSRLGIRGGIPLCVVVIEHDRWGLGRRMPKCLECLSRCATHAKEVLPHLRTIHEEMRRSDGNTSLLDRTIVTIENSTTTPPHVGLNDFADKRRGIRQTERRGVPGGRRRLLPPDE